MYYYVYDEYIQHQRFERELALIETRLTDLGISGKIARLALFRDPTELIKDEIRKGAKTIVAVGNDATLRCVIDAVGEAEAVVGMIPVGKEHITLSRILGIPNTVEACDVLSARIIEELDAGQVNGQRFLHSAVIPQVSQVEIFIDRQYKVKSFKPFSIEVRNLALESDDIPASNPTDGKLEVVVRIPAKGLFRKKKFHTSLIPTNELSITGNALIKGHVDSDALEGDTLNFTIIPKALQVITGKGRQF